MLNLREGHYFALCWGDYSELKDICIVIGMDDNRYSVVRSDDLSLYFQGGKVRDRYLYDNAERIECPAPKVAFKQATAKSILTEDVKAYYVKADNLTLKEGLEALHKGELVMEVRK